MRRVLPALLLAGLLAGCAPSPPTQSPTPDPRLECEAAVESVIDAVAELVADYEAPLVGPEQPPSATSSPTPDTDDAATAPDERLARAVDAARRIRAEKGCAAGPFDAGLEAGLEAIEPKGPMADAVLRRTTAALLGEAGRVADEHQLAADEDLRDVLASAAEGTTIILPAGTIDFDSTVVVLSGVTLRGAGKDVTTIRSSAADGAFIVAANGNVRLEGLTIALSPRPSSGVIAGSSATLALSDVRVRGARAESDGAGGAGLYLSGMGSEGSGRGTTLEVTDSVFEDNAWVGIAVSGGHQVSVESSVFIRNVTAGILFLDASTGSVADSEFTDNGVGLAAAGAATPVWTASTIRGGSVGAQVDGTAAPVMENLHIAGSSTAAVIFGGDARGWIAGATCEDVEHGIVVTDTAAPSLGENGCPLARGGT